MHRTVFCRSILLSALLFLQSYSTKSQTQSGAYFPFLLRDSLAVQNLSKEISGTVNGSYTLPPKISSKYKKHYKAIKDDACEEIADLVKYTSLLDTVINPYMQRIFQSLVKANAVPNSRLVVTRSYIDNAFASGDGTIFLNVGLLRGLENDAQVAFVISHELSHGILNHVQNNITTYLNSIYDKDLQEEYNKIIKKGYNKNKRVKALLMKVSVNNLYHQRNQESAADSMAFYLMKAAGYDPAQAYDALKLFDNNHWVSNGIFEKQSAFFQCKEGWQNFTVDASSTSIFQVKNEVDTSDSLKTHPDCRVRMAAIRKLLLSIGRDTAVSAAAPDNAFLKIKQASGYESIQSMYDYEYFDHSLFNSLNQIILEPESPYLRSMALLNLLQLKYHMQRHQYAEMVSNTGDHNTKELNQFLSFLNSLNVSDFKLLAASFEKSYPSLKLKDEFSLAATLAGAHIADNFTPANSFSNEYKKLYPTGRFIPLLQKLNYIKTKKP